MATIRNITKSILLAGGLGIVLLSLVGLVQAKMIPYVEPLDGDWGTFDEEPYVKELKGASFSGAYGRLGEPGDADVVHMRFDTPVKGPVSVELMVPVCGEHFTDFYPTLALIGPDQDMSEEAIDALPFDLPKGLGAQILEPERPDEDSDALRPLEEWRAFGQGYYEPLSITFYVPIPAKYFFAVWDENGDTGAYTLFTGSKLVAAEVSDLTDLESRFELISSGEWMGVDCDVPVSDADAAATPESDQ